MACHKEDRKSNERRHADEFWFKKFSYSSKSIKNTLAINESEERKDFLEITPTAMSEFICKKCGKTFQNHDDLIRHMSFEERKENGREISEKSRIDRQRTVPIDFKRN